MVGRFCYKLQNLLAIHQSLKLNASGLSKHLFFSFSLLSKVTVTQSSLTLCYPMDLTVHGILQAKILEWIAISFSRGSSQSRDGTWVSHIAGKCLPSELPGKPYLCILIHIYTYYNKNNTYYYKYK